jgi:hypothetical protein
MVLYNLIMETAIGQLVVYIGCAMGVFAAIDSDWEDARKLDLLSYNNYSAQIINRVLFTVGAILCLFVDFPSRADWFGKAFNFILFPAIGLMIFCMAWALTYNALRCAFWVVCWWFEKKR